MCMHKQFRNLMVDNLNSNRIIRSSRSLTENGAKTLFILLIAALITRNNIEKSGKENHLSPAGDGSIVIQQ